VWNRVTVYAAFPKQTEVVFDGYISHVDAQTQPEAGSMTVDIRGVDASYHMNQEEKARIWRGKTYETIVGEIFAEYQFTPFIGEAPPAWTRRCRWRKRATDHPLRARTWRAAAATSSTCWAPMRTSARRSSMASRRS
jgi:hypothetical protein